MFLSDDLIGDAPGLAAVRESVARLLERYPDGGRFPPVLICGETGTGKGLLARAIHRAGPRRAGPFVDLNCAAIPETLLEAELFGYERGAFTDARQSKPGLFQTAHRGTVFLDEVGLLPETLQAKLLKVLDDRVVRRLGSIRTEPVDVWVLAATSEDLAAGIRARRFREDLYHRLAVVTLWLPPLRERGADVLRLAEHFLARACADYALPPKTLAPDARNALLSHGWPGNVRELANVMERAALLADDLVVHAAALELATRARAPVAPQAERAAAVSLQAAVGEVERAHLLAALEATGWNITRAADLLGVSRNTLRYRLRRHGLRPPGGAAGTPPEAGPTAAPPGAGGPGRGGTRPPELPGAAATAAAMAGVRWGSRHVAFLRALLGPCAAADGPRLLDLVVDEVRSFGGRVEEVGSAALLALFGLDAAEDAPRRAGHAAVAILRACERASAGSPPIRLGLDVREVRVAQVGGRPEVDAEARERVRAALDGLMAAAPAPDVLVTEAAAPFLDRGFAFASASGGDAGALRILGRRDPTGLGLGAPLGPLVGRERELALLERTFREAAAGGVRVVHLTGEPGIGKSRLACELRHRLDGGPALFLQARCAAFGASTPFLPFIEVLRAVFLVGDADGPDETARKIERGLALLGLPAADVLPPLALLLGDDAGGDALRGLDRESLGARIREALHAVLRERCRLSPAVLVLDDLQWADTASIAVLDRLVSTELPMPLLLLCLYRLPHRPPWAGRAGVLEVRLAPLADEACARIARARLGEDSGAEALARVAAARAEGNPLFAEEVARYLAERAAGAAGVPEAGVVVPATLRELLLARLARLDAPLRNVLEVASVSGRRFSQEVVREAAGAGARLEADLRALEALDVVRREEAGGRVEHGFKHVLVQEAVYGSLSEERRAALHEQVAAAIERLHEGRLGEWADALAHHYARTPQVARAVRYLVLAGERSLRVYSLDEAEGRFREAVGRLEGSGGEGDRALLADAVLGWAQVYYYRGDYAGLVALLDRYRPRIEALDDPRRCALLLFWLGFGHFLGARCHEARALLARARALGEAASDELSAGYATMGLMYVEWVAPAAEAGEVARLGGRALEVARRAGDTYLASQCLLGLALDRLTQGRYAEARVLARDLIDLGRAGAPRATAVGLHVLAWAAVSEERPAEAIDHAEEALRVAPDPADRLMARAAKGVAVTLAGRPREGRALLEEVRAEVEVGGYQVLRLGLDVVSGAAAALAGDLAAGVAEIEAAIRRFAAWGNRFEPARGHVGLGEIYLRMLRRDDRRATLGLRNLGFVLRSWPFAARRARRHFEEALRIARSADLPAVEARASLGLGLVCRLRGRPEEAARHLEHARALAEALGAETLLDRVRAAQAETRAPAAPRGAARRRRRAG